jgi:hypothetical protein
MDELIRKQMRETVSILENVGDCRGCGRRLIDG